MNPAEALSATRHRLAEAGIEDADIEAEVLLRHALGLDRAHLFARLRDSLGLSQEAAFETLVARRLKREPTPYITGHKEFYGLDFEVTRAAIIPRAETELLVDEALAAARERKSAPEIVDAGCGCGAIVCALAHHLPRAVLCATDFSAGALVLARRNAERLGLSERIRFLQGDLLDPVIGPVDIIVANLPYVRDDEWDALQPEIRDFEPREALVAGPAGTEAIEGLLGAAPEKLRRPGLLLAETGWDQGERLTALARERFPEGDVSVKKDAAGLDRLLRIAVS